MKLNFCPECAAPLRRKTDTDYVCDNGHPYWNNPRTAVAIILLKENGFLAAKRAREPHKGKCDFPGGFLEYGENAETAARRELEEETGLSFHTLELIDTGIHSYLENISVSDLVFISTDWKGEIRTADDVAALEWKPLEFIESNNFAWSYPGLLKKLQPYRK